MFLMPLRGVSAIDAPGQPFWWPEADSSYLSAFKMSLGGQVQLAEVDAHINDESFARAVAESLLEMMSSGDAPSASYARR